MSVAPAITSAVTEWAPWSPAIPLEMGPCKTGGHILTPMSVGTEGARLDDMNIEELAAAIQFVVDAQGRVTSVVLTPEAWQQLVAHLEDAEDRALLETLAPRLSSGPEGALRWADVERDWA